jgi:hypothetical protein
MASRLGAGVRLGLAVSLVVACGDSAAPPRVQSVDIAPSPASVVVGGTQQLTATPKDASGGTVSGTTATWTSANQAVATVSSSGLVTGVTIGSTTVSARINGVAGTATVNVTPPPVASVAIEPAAPSTTVGGTVQLTATPRDASGNPIAGRVVTWSSANQTIATVGVANGLVAGVSVGSTQIIATAEGVTGSVTVTITPAGPALTITSITPNPLSAGATATIAGTGFSPSLGTNGVTVGGLPVTVTAATATSLTVTIPNSICLPTGNATVRVFAAGGEAQTDHPFQATAPPVTVAVGQQLIFTEPSAFCLQFTGGATPEFYAIGVQSVSEVPSTLTPVTVRGAIPAGSSPSTMIVGEALTSAPPAVAPLEVRTPLARRWQRHRQAELALRGEERTLPFGQLANVDFAASAAAAIPGNTQAGDTVIIKVPTAGALCTSSTPVRAVVRHVGQHAFWAEDVENPTGGLTVQDFQNLSGAFDNQIWSTNTSYFGVPSDRDSNSRIVILVTKEVNRRRTILGFVSSGDFITTANCPASNQGEYFYSVAPDPAGTYALGEYTVEDARIDLPKIVAHEFTHIIQFGRRLQVAPQGPVQSVWELEGQAVLAEEVVGHAFTGNQIRQNLGIGVAINQDQSGMPLHPIDWYLDAFIGLFLYYGFQSQTTRLPNAPEECGWLTTVLADLGPCLDGQGVYGVSWSFLRWLSDQFGPTFPGGEQAIHRALIESTRVGFANIASVIGEPVDRLLSQWAATLYVDDGIPGLNTRLTMASWNLFDINTRLLPATARLTPKTRAFGNFSDALNVRAGSSAYYRLSGSNRPATALSVTSPAGSLPSHMRIWLVRIQ